MILLYIILSLIGLIALAAVSAVLRMVKKSNIILSVKDGKIFCNLKD
jgi:hypothetical protein